MYMQRRCDFTKMGEGKDSGAAHRGTQDPPPPPSKRSKYRICVNYGRLKMVPPDVTF